MSNKELKIKEKFKQALTSTIRVIADDLKISKLNEQWRNKASTTDVLSFPVCYENMVLPKNHCVELGDIVISVPTAQCQAKDQNHGLDTELRWLVSHGLLHLLGWDHRDCNELDKMLILQEYLISKLN